MEKVFGPVVVGEWSLATDNCAMWLNGFNDNLPGFPRLPCKYIPCSDPYMGDEQPGTPVDPSKPAQGPYGTGMSGPIFGMCPVGRDWLTESSKENSKNWMKAPPTAPYGRDASDEVMRNLALKKINTFSGFGHGFYFWNFRTDVSEPHWSYMEALEKGWIPKGNLNDLSITDACHKEDNGLYECVAKRGQLERIIKKGIDYVCKVDGNQTFTVNGTFINAEIVANMTGEPLYELADQVYNEYWKKHRLTGATCDFGGTAELKEVNVTDSTTIPFNEKTDDEKKHEYDQEINMIILIVFVAFGVIFGSVLGFCVAMRKNKGFNQRVQKSRLGASLSRNKFLYRSFGGFQNDYREVPSSTRRY